MSMSPHEFVLALKAGMIDYARLSGKGRRFIKGQKYTLLARPERVNDSGTPGVMRLVSKRI